MKVILAKTAGFCYGVNRAVNMLENEIGKSKILGTYGPIIHNTTVVDSFRQLGVNVYDSAESIREDSVVLIRSHGVSKDEMLKISEKSGRILDATCPFVKKIHNIVEKYHNLGYNIYIIGDIEHPEVKGILGWCNNDATVFNSPKDIPDDLIFGKKFV